MKYQIIEGNVEAPPNFPLQGLDVPGIFREVLFFLILLRSFHWLKASILQPVDGFHHSLFAKLVRVHLFHQPES